MQPKQTLAFGYAFLFSLFFFSPAFSQKLDTVQLNSKQPVLNGRAFFSLPAGAINEARGVDIMSADNNLNEETRFVMDIGKMRLVLFAREVYLLADKNLASTMTASNAKSGFTTTILADKDSLLAILSTPGKFDKTKEAILVNSLLVKTPDNTLFRFDAYVNPDAYELRSDYQKLTEKIFSTITKGNRRNVLYERTETFPSITGNKKFVFRIPANYCVTTDKKYDFQVYKFHKFQNFSQASDYEQLIVYTGFYPSEVYKDFGLTEQNAQKVKGTFLGKPIEWLQFNIPSQGLVDKEQKISADNLQERMVIHVAMISNQQKTIDNLTKMVEGIRLE